MMLMKGQFHWWRKPDLRLNDWHADGRGNGPCLEYVSPVLSGSVSRPQWVCLPSSVGMSPVLTGYVSCPQWVCLLSLVGMSPVLSGSVSCSQWGTSNHFSHCIDFYFKLFPQLQELFASLTNKLICDSCWRLVPDSE